ncbi:hypothetical protein [Taylorella equigenitalis]|uniref:hypothetical protein n=1 Tax=Taylorella equigenitalis TaxID=29575 RepID=UPI00237D507C|nr:hypothetical protein [Taylorella equigenitalis]WDU52667.1 hypothetical protein KNO32_06300 [Taylorella equigenitalis]WEE00124.1 hypothetical protein PZB79_06005 [Taylorella equigenitalis]WEE01601.1 hypothetical protein PZB80_06010 [Taylorella equigenitalis]WFD78138.1 hypothetical protein P7C95_06020 [Taylorella equigenitalis]WFD79616.1 hypothetical protein P7C94_06015 [Taylorella equigenitalis]
MFSANFCPTKSIQKSGASTEQEDVSTICSDGKDYEAGSREEGNITLNFFLSPNHEVQQLLEKYEFSGEKFWTKLELSNNQGSYLFYGSIETGLSIDGSVGGRWESSVTIKLSGRRYFIKGE